MGGYEPVAMRVLDDEERAGAAEVAKARKVVSMWITGAWIKRQFSGFNKEMAGVAASEGPADPAYAEHWAGEGHKLAATRSGMADGDEMALEETMLTIAIPGNLYLEFRPSTP